MHIHAHPFLHCNSFLSDTVVFLRFWEDVVCSTKKSSKDSQTLRKELLLSTLSTRSFFSLSPSGNSTLLHIVASQRSKPPAPRPPPPSSCTSPTALLHLILIVIVIIIIIITEEVQFQTAALEMSTCLRLLLRSVSCCGPSSPDEHRRLATGSLWQAAAVE